MHTKRVRIGGTVFLAESEFDLGWGGNLSMFQTEDAADFMLQIRTAHMEEDTPHSGGFAKVVRNGNRFLIALSEKWRVQPTLWHMLNMLPFTELLLEQGTLTMHASYICHEGKGILFSGPSGIGKSTQAGLWTKYRGAREINGDRVLITPVEHGAMADSHFLCGTSGICSNVTSPLKAIVLLEQAEQNAILPASALQILRMVMGQIDYAVTDREQLIKVSGLVEKLLQNTVVCRFGCRIDENAVETLEQYLYQI